jgi:hypothetical protein
VTPRSAGEADQRRRDAQPVPIRVGELALAAGKTFLVNRDTELRGHGLDVDHIQMDKAGLRRVTCVLRQVASRDGNEPREAGLELVLPFLPKSEPFVPLNRPFGVRNSENRHNLLVHAQSLGGPKIWQASINARADYDSAFHSTP